MWNDICLVWVALTSHSFVLWDEHMQLHCVSALEHCCRYIWEHIFSNIEGKVHPLHTG